jgi:TM2 domain-containing membrane protein YozV
MDTSALGPGEILIVLTLIGLVVGLLVVVSQAGREPTAEAERTGLVFCVDCGKPVSVRAAACPHCGAPRVRAGGRKSRGVAIFLALVFGGLGAHKFYLERPGLGLLYLLFCWTLVPSIVALIEAIGYLLMSEERFAALASPRR